jgi:ribosomal protein S18 acetylase RimI-like enzyme
LEITIVEMTIKDYGEVISLWQKTPGLGLTSSDSKEEINKFLDRNPGFSFVAREGDKLVGAALCGHDGRRGYLHHMAVENDYRKHGIGKYLAESCLDRLKKAGIPKVHLFVYTDNQTGQAFWEATGWVERVELLLYSKEITILKDLAE